MIVGAVGTPGAAPARGPRVASRARLRARRAVAAGPAAVQPSRRPRDLKVGPLVAVHAAARAGAGARGSRQGGAGECRLGRERGAGAGAGTHRRGGGSQTTAVEGRVRAVRGGSGAGWGGAQGVWGRDLSRSTGVNRLPSRAAVQVALKVCLSLSQKVGSRHGTDFMFKLFCKNLHFLIRPQENEPLGWTPKSPRRSVGAEKLYYNLANLLRRFVGEFQSTQHTMENPTRSAYVEVPNLYFSILKKRSNLSYGLKKKTRIRIKNVYSSKRDLTHWFCFVPSPARTRCIALG